MKDRAPSRAGRGDRGRGPSFDARDLEGVARRLAGGGGGASALTGAASGLAGGGLAGRFLGGSTGGSDEDFKREVLEQLALLDERLLRLEEQMGDLLGEGITQDPAEPTEPGATTDPADNP